MGSHENEIRRDGKRKKETELNAKLPEGESAVLGEADGAEDSI